MLGEDLFLLLHNATRLNIPDIDWRWLERISGKGSGTAVNGGGSGTAVGNGSDNGIKW